MAINYYSALTQVVLVGFVCFLCPGMFNAVSGLGGGGQLDTTAANNASTALYSTFIVFGVAGGGIVNLCGVRWTIFVSGFTYALYSASYIFLNHHPRDPSFTIASGALLGAGAGVLWAAQGLIMTSYSREEEKGRFIAIFWTIFNLGGVLGGILPFAINYNSDKDSLSDGVYIAFVVLECLGACMGLTLAPPAKVKRLDGTSVVLAESTSPAREAVEIVKLFLNPTMLALLPMCFTSNFFYTYQFNRINAGLFNIRTRGFNNIFYWGSQMVGSCLISLLLDTPRFKRKVRGFLAFAVVFVFFNSIWGGSLALHNKYPQGIEPGSRIDFKESSKASGAIVLYVLCGASDALFQSLAYWIIASLTRDNQKLSRYVGFYKGIQSLGSTVAWQLDIKVSPLTQLITNWALFGGSVIPMLWVIWSIKDHEEAAVKADDAELSEKDALTDVSVNA
ncbi:hypothetical protein LPJ61_002380 [Coemansia biformis]|uniref:MFS general substrate transporter n=1 Tax=Coemansia biformis TaxID=1286918 RepID=A0A9W7YCL0_9FUNG|nr:hypothetical protein LPJ61_002380 [Coemansia biformis]